MMYYDEFENVDNVDSDKERMNREFLFAYLLHMLTMNHWLQNSNYSSVKLLPEKGRSFIFSATKLLQQINLSDCRVHLKDTC